MSGAAATLKQINAWHVRLVGSRSRLAFLTDQRGLDRSMIDCALLGWDGTRYTIPVPDERGEFVNVRRYGPGAAAKVISLNGYGQVRLYTPTDPPADDALVLVVEGELDCLKAAQECDDLWVVTGTGGAGNPPILAALERVRGRNVVIAYDCDDPGRMGARKLADQLGAVAATVAILDLGLGEGEDVTDWFVTHGRTADELRELIRAASHREPAPPSNRRDAAELLKIAVSRKVDELGSRNDAGFWLACQLWDERYTEGEIWRVMQRLVSRVANDKDHPYTESEARNSMRQALSRPRREPSGLSGVTNTGRFRLIGPTELAAPVEPMKWLIRGVWTLGSYGPWGGAKKTLKTYCASIAAISVASGLPAFGNPEWTVPRARPVIYYGGEGGREMHQRRFQRIARDVYGIEDISAIPFYLVTDIGPFNTEEFWTALHRNIDEVNEAHPDLDDGVGLVVLDSLYTYHPANIEVSNLYERGRLLAELSAPLIHRGIALWVVDHMNKSGSGIDLDRLAQSGMSAWADSWLLFEHGEDPDVVNGTFTLSTGIGSRQWGGEEWTLHIDIGPFDKETSTYFTTMKVEAQSGITKGKRRVDGEGTTNDELDAGLLEFIEGHTDLTKEQVLSGVMDMWSVGKPRATRRFEALEDRGRITGERRSRLEHGQPRTRLLWSVAPISIRIKTKSTSEASPKGSEP